MGIYQLCFLKMHGKLLFLAQNAETGERAFLAQVLADTLSLANKAMQGKNFSHSPYRAKISALTAAAAAALVRLEQDERSKMREEILTALETITT